MGYSCAAKASFVEEAITYLTIKADPKAMSNGLPGKPVGWFYERGRENATGNITGTVWKPAGTPGMVNKAGSYCIDRTGKILRFPGLETKYKREAETMAAEKYHEIYEVRKVQLFNGNPFEIEF